MTGKKNWWLTMATERALFQQLPVVVASVCLVAFFNVLSFAQTPEVQPAKKVQLNLGKLVADVIAQALAAKGIEVYSEDNSVAFATPRGHLITMHLPRTLENLKNEMRVDVDGVEVKPKSSVDPNAISQVPDAKVNQVASLIDCLNISLDIWFAKLGLCDLTTQGGTDNILCIIRATLGFADNVLTCIFKLGEV